VKEYLQVALQKPGNGSQFKNIADFQHRSKYEASRKLSGKHLILMLLPGTSAAILPSKVNSKLFLFL
jgi:hypothetical protein